MRFLLLSALAVGAAGCKKAPNHPQAGDVWSEFCKDSDPVQSWIRLEANGTFSYTYPEPDEWNQNPKNKWKVEGDQLVISWNNNYASTRYDLTGLKKGELSGVSTKSCGTNALLIRQ